MAEETLNKFEQSYKAGDIIFCEYEKGEEFYIVKEGKVRITKIQDNKEKTLDVFEVSQIFGEMAIIEDAPRSATAVAETDVKLVVLKKQSFFELLGSQPTWALSLIKILSKRIFDAQRRLRILSLDEDEAKVLDTILMLVEWKGINPENYPSNAPIPFDGVNSETLAHWCGLSTRDCEIHIDRYVRMGRLERNGNNLVVKNLNEIARIVKNKRKLQENKE
ncbi:MAG: hypothetical protein A2014_12015 [Spirochaetes bacterium GWF1_49_6]|jgi:CRP-like cAMP-binding protein|nr:MAG: hypothetical protein A2014_12015 [Spirochaetes bacterium GWF1_49_6]